MLGDFTPTDFLICNTYKTNKPRKAHDSLAFTKTLLESAEKTVLKAFKTRA